MMKKTMCLVLAMLMVLSLAACGSETQEATTEEGFQPSLDTSASCSITELALPDSISTIGSNVFEGCYHLQKVKLPAGLRCIPFGMFQRCSALRDITLPESVETVENDAFAGCTSLEELRIPAALTDIREYAFEYSPDIKLILAEKGGEAEAYCVSHHITYSYAENE